jgi:hypothetical protein
MEITKADLQEWKANKVTEALFKHLSEEIEERKDRSRVRDSSHMMVVENAVADGFMDGCTVANDWYEDAMEELNED